ncbi:MAG TPA: biosynthetic-type acetolactate synthase large subunit [Dehalococcoidia bacterium]|nr:biosynthetic-type acetolactate synthase large subunit [Dehalococcoidia bacterium]
MRRTGAQILLECLVREGVETIFGYPGGVVLPLYDRLPEFPKLKHVLVRHEQGAAHAADGWARASGKTGVCLATSGPGATNLVTGICTAMMDSVPMVALTGNVARNLLGKDGFQEADITGITLPITKHNYLVMKASDIAYTVREAFHIASTGRKGPVLIDIPKDVFIEEAEFHWPEKVVPRGYRPTTAGHAGQIKRAARLVDDSKRPIILAGHGVILSGATAELRAFAEKAQIPVLTTFLGLGGFPEDHVLSYGFMGMHGAYHANHAADKADVVLGIGMRFDDRAMGRFQDFNPGAEIIHIDIDPAEIGKNIKTSVPIVGDVRAVLSSLIEAIGPNTHLEWIKWIDQLSAEHPSFVVPDTDEISTQYVIHEIHEACQGESIIVTGVGQHQMWAAQHFTFRRPRQLISSGGLGTMGFEVPAALGAQLARPGELVWALCGDGGFQMTMQELATIVDQKAPVKIAIMNNGFLGMIRQWQELFYENNLVAADLRTDLCQPDFVMLAGAYGIKALRVTDKTDVRAAIEEANAYPGPVLIDFRVRQEENVWPMVPAGASLAETVEEPRETKVRA